MVVFLILEFNGAWISQRRDQSGRVACAGAIGIIDVQTGLG
jgi:hypothetical protein